MKLFYSKGACSLALRIVINEIGVKAEYESVNLKTKKTETERDYFQINAKGSVPALEIKPNEVLTEASVILQYLADSNKATHLLPPTDNFKRYRVLEWLNYVASEMHKGVGIMFNQTLTPDMKAQIFVPIIKTKLSFLDKHLHTNQYLLGKDFTLPDAYLFVILNWCAAFKLDLKEWQHVARYFEELKKRKSIVESLKQESLVTA